MSDNVSLINRRREMLNINEDVFGVRTKSNLQGGSFSIPHIKGMVWEYTFYYLNQDGNMDDTLRFDNRDMGLHAGTRVYQRIGMTAEKNPYNTGFTVAWTRDQNSGSGYNVKTFRVNDLITVRYAFPTFYYCVNGTLYEHTETGNVYEDVSKSLIFRIPNSYVITNIKIWNNGILENDFAPDVKEKKMLDKITGLFLYHENFEFLNLTKEKNITKKTYEDYYSAMPIIS